MDCQHADIWTVLLRIPRSPRRFFQMCKWLSIFYILQKAHCLRKTVRWCGRIIDKHDIRTEPRQVEGLETMEEPKKGRQPLKLVCALKWFRQYIPDLQLVINQLEDFMKRVYAATGNRTKQGKARIQVKEHSWGISEPNVFITCKNALFDRGSLVHGNNFKCLCIYRDSSDQH